MLSSAKDIAVTNQESYDQALAFGKKVSALEKLIDAEEKKITKPLNESLKAARDMFRPFKTQVEETKNDIKAKMSEWFTAEEARKKKEEERIAARVERGTMKEETAVAKLEAMENPLSSGGMTSVLLVFVTDFPQIPRKYLIVDESAIKADFRAGVEIPGVRCQYEKRARL